MMGLVAEFPWHALPNGVKSNAIGPGATDGVTELCKLTNSSRADSSHIMITVRDVFRRPAWRNPAMDGELVARTASVVALAPGCR